MSSQAAISELNLVAENCRASLKALVDDVHIDDVPPDINFAILRTDFLSILSLLYAASTKVALALKPPSLANQPAAIVPLKDLSANVAALTHSVLLMHQVAQGQTLLAEYKRATQNTIRSIDHFVDGLLASISQTQPNQNYLVAVNKVHELIDNARRPGALSLDNKTAVRKQWLQNRESLSDGAEEIQEMVNPSNDSIDSGWDDLGLASKHEFSPEEKTRLEMLQGLVKLSNLLHKRILVDLLSTNSPNTVDVSTMDQLATYSSRLLVASDNLISTMYPIQQPSLIALQLRGYLEVLKGLQVTLLPRKDQDLDEQFAGLSVSGQSQTKTVKWFTICFDEIAYAAGKLSGILEGNTIS